jgi:hypothetical protein
LKRFLKIDKPLPKLTKQKEIGQELIIPGMKQDFIPTSDTHSHKQIYLYLTTLVKCIASSKTLSSTTHPV